MNAVDLALAEPRPRPATRPRSAAGLCGAIDCDELQRHGRAQLPGQEGAAEGQEAAQGASLSSSPRSRRHPRVCACAYGSTELRTAQGRTCERLAALADSRSQRLFRTPHLLFNSRHPLHASNRADGRRTCGVALTMLASCGGSLNPGRSHPRVPCGDYGHVSLALLLFLRGIMLIYPYSAAAGSSRPSPSSSVSGSASTCESPRLPPPLDNLAHPRSFPSFLNILLTICGYIPGHAHKYVTRQFLYK